MKNKLVKVKRKYVNWYQLLLDIGDLRMSQDFWSLKSKHPMMSNNRISWNVLKRYYSTTALAYVRVYGGSIEHLAEWNNMYQKDQDDPVLLPLS